MDSEQEHQQPCRQDRRAQHGQQYAAQRHRTGGARHPCGAHRVAVAGSSGSRQGAVSQGPELGEVRQQHDQHGVPPPGAVCGKKRHGQHRAGYGEGRRHGHAPSPTSGAPPQNQQQPQEHAARRRHRCQKQGSAGRRRGPSSPHLSEVVQRPVRRHRIETHRPGQGSEQQCRQGQQRGNREPQPHDPATTPPFRVGKGLPSCR